MKEIFIFGIGLLLTSQTIGQKIATLPPSLEAMQPINLFPVTAEKDFVFTDRNADTHPGVFTVAVQSNGSRLISAEVLTATPAHGNIQVAWKSTGPVKKGDALLARLSIRAIYARQESGDGVVNYFVQQAVAPFDRNILAEMHVGPEWKTYDIPFAATSDMEAGEASIGFTFGALAQKIEITNVQLLNFEQKTTLAKLPATGFSYAGREKDAAWRKEALNRIEKIRTAPLVIQVKDANGKPLRGARVTAKLIDPDFIFGTAVSVSLLNNNDADGINYRKRLLELFNAVTIDNNLQWSDWRDVQKREETKTAVQWINNQGLHLRGHNLVWPGKKFTPAFFSKQPDFGPGFSDSITKHIEDIATYTKGKVYAWDVINEMMHEKDYFKVIPRSQAVAWFKQAKRIDPGAQLYINEYSMLNNIASPKNIQTYLELIAELRNGGAPIDAIGVQGHVGRQPRNPAQVLTDLDMFTPTGLPVQITEFDINSPDEAMQADYTRDFLIACYSHPVVTGFTMWGFWQGAHWKPDAAMFRKDWTAKPNEAVWREWVTGKWKSTLATSSDKKGETHSRGHLGLYEITVTKGKSTVTVNYQLTKKSLPVLIKL